jgi:hypothetical protein
VAEVVVDRLEVVEIEEEDRDRAVAPVHARERVLEAVHEERAVRQLRQRVLERLLGKAVESRVLDGAKRRVLDDERPLERELLDELALLVAPVALSARVCEQHEAERPPVRHERDRHEGLEPEYVDELTRQQRGRDGVLDEDGCWASRCERPDTKFGGAQRLDAVTQGLLECRIAAQRHRDLEAFVLAPHQQGRMLDA